MIKQKLTLALSLILLAGLTVFAQQMAFNTPQKATINTGKASFQWQKTTYSFGKITQNKPAKATFSFVNTGNEPLVITSAVGSCGCTVANYPKQPIRPGQKGEVTAVYNAAKPGSFNKTITLTSNAQQTKTVLSINGEVVKK
ncbi:DUF1573 domain-containing protein [uncultured Microscilla sp.]|uniref:DUF1573 domain-containing protein n=1 Tax=uncultured Microscilla sp. TaxID=432653 RepID=UPI00260AA8AD|nr:DUF1573 domain-containing protein [uncultured Microscilla sp.]